MSRTFETKRKILELLKGGSKTPTDLSNTLKLSPSTISQHLKELRESGRIDEFQDEHFHNIKHYAISQNMSMILSNRARYIPVIAIVAICAVVIFFAMQGSPNAPKALLAGQPNSVGIFLTDPPHVPLGTQALLVSYAAVRVEMTNSSGTFWETINSSGSVDLMSLINSSRNLTSFILPANTVVDSVELGITNASINVNGTVYPVNLPQSDVALKVIYSNSSSQNPYDILFDMSPTVSILLTGNQTYFVMVPSGTAVAIAKSNNSYYNANVHGSDAIVKLSGQEEALLGASRPTIDIANAYLNSTNGQTYLSLNVSDDSNRSTSLLTVMVIGNSSYLLNLNYSVNGSNKSGVRLLSPAAFAPSVSVVSNAASSASAGISNQAGVGQANDAPSATYPNTAGQGSATAKTESTPVQPSAYGWRNTTSATEQVASQASGGLGINGIGASGETNYTFHIRLNNSMIGATTYNLSNSTVNYVIASVEKIGNGINISANASANLSSSLKYRTLVSNINSEKYIVTKERLFRSIDLFVMQNGTLENPQALDDMAIQGIGYTLNPGESVDLKYSGQVTLGPGVVLQLKPGQTYHIIVIGSQGAYASANVTAQ